MTRIESGARQRQRVRRVRRMQRVLSVPTERVAAEVPEHAIRQRLGEARGYLGRLRTLAARTEEVIARLERRLPKKEAR